MKIEIIQADSICIQRVSMGKVFKWLDSYYIKTNGTLEAILLGSGISKHVNLGFICEFRLDQKVQVIGDLSFTA